MLKRILKIVAATVILGVLTLVVYTNGQVSGCKTTMKYALRVSDPIRYMALEMNDQVDPVVSAICEVALTEE